MQLILLQDEMTLIFFLVIGIIARIIVAFIIYNDAKDRGMDSDIYLLLNCCCGCCCGGIVYLIAASDHQKTPPRPQFYGQPQPQYSQPKPAPSTPPPSYPPAGPQLTNQTYIAPGTRLCPHCGQTVYPPESKFCSNCGNQIY